MHFEFFSEILVRSRRAKTREYSVAKFGETLFKIYKNMLYDADPQKTRVKMYCNFNLSIKT